MHLKIHPRAIARKIGEHTIVEHLDSPLSRLILSPTATSIWTLLERGETSGSIVTQLAQTYETNEAAVTQDVTRFIDQLVARHILVAEGHDLPPVAEASAARPPSGESLLYETLVEAARQNRVPHKASLEVTYRCNLRCIQCYVAPMLTDVVSHQTQLGTKRLKEIITELRELGCLQITFTGGELFTRPDVLQLLRHADAEGCAIRVQTNGLMIRPHHVAALRELQRLESFEISLFGVSEATYDTVTRHGSFRQFQEMLELFRDTDLPVVLKFVMMQQNVHEAALARPFAESYGLRGLVCFMHVYPSTLGCLSNDDQRLDGDTVRELFVQRVIVPGQVATPDSHWLCRAGLVRLSITPTGEMWPCERLPFSFGNVRDQSVRDVWLSDRAERYRSMIAEPHSRCGSCELR